MKNTIEEIRKIISGQVIKSEEQVRLAIIYRIIFELDWNIWNPNEVLPEFVVVPHEDRGKVDIALFGENRNSSVFIEIKSLNKIQNRFELSKTEKQLRDYNRDYASLISIITDGTTWRFYYPLTQGTFASKCIKTINLVTDDLTDIELAFMELLKKSDIENGNSKKYALYLLEEKQKWLAFKSYYDEALTLITQPPFPSLPECLMSLMNEQGFQITPEEITEFIKHKDKFDNIENNDNESVEDTYYETQTVEEDEELVEDDFTELKNPSLDTLKFTTLTSVSFGNEKLNKKQCKWKELLRIGLRKLYNSNISFSEYTSKLTLNIKKGQHEDDGFSFVEGTDFSFQGVEAIIAAKNLVTMSKLLNQNIIINFTWRNNERASHPGQTGIIYSHSY